MNACRTKLRKVGGVHSVSFDDHLGPPVYEWIDLREVGSRMWL